MILWLMTASQLIASAWFSLRGGKLNDREFFIFTGAMMIGQLGLGYETYQQHADRALLIQIYSIVLTAIGGIQRYRLMKKDQNISN